MGDGVLFFEVSIAGIKIKYRNTMHIGRTFDLSSVVEIQTINLETCIGATASFGSNPTVTGLYFFVILQFFWRTSKRYYAFVDYINVVGNTEGKTHVLLNQKD